MTVICENYVMTGQVKRLCFKRCNRSHVDAAHFWRAPFQPQDGWCCRHFVESNRHFQRNLRSLVTPPLILFGYLASDCRYTFGPETSRETRRAIPEPHFHAFYLHLHRQLISGTDLAIYPIHEPPLASPSLRLPYSSCLHSPAVPSALRHWHRAVVRNTCFLAPCQGRTPA